MDEYHVDTVQLDQVIPDNELSVIAAYFDSVVLYSQAMGLSAAEQHHVKTTIVLYDTQTAMMCCLKFWKEHRPSMATYRALMELLLRLNRTAVATQVCQYLAQNVSIYTVCVCLPYIHTRYIYIIISRVSIFADFISWDSSFFAACMAILNLRLYKLMLHAWVHA